MKIFKSSFHTHCKNNRHQNLLLFLLKWQVLNKNASTRFCKKKIRLDAAKKLSALAIKKLEKNSSQALAVKKLYKSSASY